MTIDDCLVLGKLGYKPAEGSQVATLIPLSYLDQKTDEWTECGEDPKLFPDRGRVHCYIRGTKIDVNHSNLWIFKLEKSHTYGEHNSDQFEVSPSPKPEAPVLIVDLQYLGDERAIREVITSEGIELDHWDGGEIIVQIQPKIWVGPMTLVRLESGRWRLSKFNFHYIFPEAGGLILREEGSLAVRSRWEKKEKCFWQPNERVLTRYFNRLKKVEKIINGHPITRAIVKQVSQEITDFNVTLSEQEDMIGIGLRAQEIFQGIEKETELFQSALDQFMDRDIVQKELQQRKDDAFQKLLEEKKKELKASTANEKKKLVQAREKLKTLNDDSELLKKKIEELRREQQHLSDRFDKSLESKMREVTERPAEWLAETAFVRAYLNLERPSQKASPFPPDQVRETSLRESNPNPQTIPGDHGMKKLQMEFMKTGYSQNLAAQLLASFLAGLVPTLTHQDAHLLLASFAHIFTGDHLHWSPVSPTFITPEDVFCHSSSGELRMRDDLQELFSLAQDDHRLHLWVLDGVNRASVENYLLPLLACHRDSRQNQFPPRALTIHKGGGQLSRVTWPKNLLLAVTLAEGAATLPLPHGYWAYGTFFPTELFRDDRLTDLDVQAEPPSMVRPEEWWVLSETNGRETTFKHEGLSTPANKDGAAFASLLSKLGQEKNDVEAAWSNSFATPRLMGNKTRPHDRKEQSNENHDFENICNRYMEF